MGAGRVKSTGLSLEGRQVFLIQSDAGNNCFSQHCKLSETLQCTGQLTEDVREFQSRCPRLGDYIIIREIEKSLMQPVKLPYQPFASVPCNSVPRLSTRSYAEPRWTTADIATDNDEMLRVDLPRPF